MKNAAGCLVSIDHSWAESKSRTSPFSIESGEKLSTRENYGGMASNPPSTGRISIITFTLRRLKILSVAERRGEGSRGL
jgi:hypothetical protein